MFKLDFNNIIIYIAICAGKLKEITRNMEKSIISLLDQFMKGNKVVLKDHHRKDPKIFHYYTEIIRFWSKLNFIIQKTLRSIELTEQNLPYPFAEYFYWTYRIIMENCDISELIKDSEVLKDTPLDKVSMDFLMRIKTFSWNKALKGKSMEEQLSIKEATPSFFIKKLRPVMDFKTITKHVKAMNNIQTQKFFTAYLREDIENTLDWGLKDDLKDYPSLNLSLFKKDSDIPWLWHIPIHYKKVILNLDAFNKGKILLLDKASAAVVNILEPMKEEVICDMCAAPGIKSSLISNLVDNYLYLIAAEFHKKRINTLKAYLSNLTNPKMFLLNTDSIQFPIRFNIKVDKILLDAPCSGSGTFISNPELKWRQNEEFLHQNVILQEKLLKSALNLLKPSGTIVYSTCSLYAEEGERQILKVIDQLEPLDLPNWIGKSYRMDGNFIAGTGRLFPAQHQTQGFFIGKFKKKD